MSGLVARTMQHVAPVQWWLGGGYAALVAATAAIGFAGDSTPMILVAVLVSLPGSLLAVPGYYLAYALLALVPGANPSASSGSGSCTPDGTCTVETTGGLAPWFHVTTDVLGVLALTCAAVLNVVALAVVRTQRAAAGGTTSTGA